MATFYIQNFGCRASQADGAALERQFAERGLARAREAGEAQTVVLNTCTVTASADRDLRNAVRRIHRANPGCRIVVTGCYAQRAPKEVAALPGVSQVIGNSHKHQLAQIALAPASPDFVPLANLHVGDIFAHTELMAAPVFDCDSGWEKTRPNLKVQDGCDNRCSFCVIPSVRGQSRSLQLEQVLREVDALVAAGYREIVLSGINLGRWGRDLDPPLRFEHMVRAVLEGTVVEKLRLSSIEPMDWSDELITMLGEEPRLAKHAHVPLQSGCDRVLRRMHRRYRPWHYAERIQKIRAAVASAAIGADVMVGFPGETEEEFEENRAFIASLPFTYLHVFAYSARPGTPAAAAPNQVSKAVKQERSRVLRELAAAKNLAFRQSFVGGTLSAITLRQSEGEGTQALSENYVKLRLRGEHAPNQWLVARIEAVNEDGLAGRVVRPDGTAEG